MIMEQSIGKPFRVNGVAYIAVADDRDDWACLSCAIHDYCEVSCGRVLGFGECIGFNRSDGINVHFELVEDDKQALLQKGGE